MKIRGIWKKTIHLCTVYADYTTLAIIVSSILSCNALTLLEIS